MAGLYAVEIDLGDGRGFRRAGRGEGVPREVAEVAKEHLLHVADELSVRWDVRVVRINGPDRTGPGTDVVDWDRPQRSSGS